MKRLSVVNKTKFKTLKQVMKANGVDEFNHTAKEILKAYSDCRDDLNGEEYPQNLAFFQSHPIVAKDLIKVMKAAIPHGYNCFDAEKSCKQLIEIFGEDALYFVAREGSVAIYIKPQGSSNLWVKDKEYGLDQLKADEVLFRPDLGMFRVWWD